MCHVCCCALTVSTVNISYYELTLCHIKKDHDVMYNGVMVVYCFLLLCIDTAVQFVSES